MKELNILVCSEGSSDADVLSRAAASLRIHTTMRSAFEDAQEVILTSKIDCVVVDASRFPRAVDFLQMLRRSPSNGRVAAICMVRDSAGSSGLSCAGATFVLGTPVSMDLCDRTLRAACTLMLRERRCTFRARIRIPVWMTDATGSQHRGFITNLSTGGAAIETASLLTMNTLLKMSFHLPSTIEEIRAQAQIVWIGTSIIGIRFLAIPAKQSQTLRNWLSQKFDEEMATVWPCSSKPSRVVSR